jgi:hypothetical protein
MARAAASLVLLIATYIARAASQAPAAAAAPALPATAPLGPAPQTPEPRVPDSTRIVSTNVEMHAALTTESVTHIMLKNNVTSEGRLGAVSLHERLLAIQQSVVAQGASQGRPASRASGPSSSRQSLAPNLRASPPPPPPLRTHAVTLQSCPPGTAIYAMRRDVHVASMPGAPTYWFDCGLLPSRAVINRTITFERVGVVNCYTDTVRARAGPPPQGASPAEVWEARRPTWQGVRRRSREWAWTWPLAHGLGRPGLASTPLALLHARRYPDDGLRGRVEGWQARVCQVRKVVGGGTLLVRVTHQTW